MTNKNEEFIATKKISTYICTIPTMVIIYLIINALIAVRFDSHTLDLALVISVVSIPTLYQAITMLVYTTKVRLGLKRVKQTAKNEIVAVNADLFDVDGIVLPTRNFVAFVCGTAITIKDKNIHVIEDGEMHVIPIKKILSAHGEINGQEMISTDSGNDNGFSKNMKKPTFDERIYRMNHSGLYIRIGHIESPFRIFRTTNTETIWKWIEIIRQAKDAA